VIIDNIKDELKEEILGPVVVTPKNVLSSQIILPELII